jgi:septum formation protein
MRAIAPGYETMVPDIDEKAIRHANASFLVSKIALEKSRALRNRVGDAVLITADTVVVCNSALREKPADITEAVRFIRSYRQHPAIVVTGVVAFSGATGRDASVVDTTTVEFKLLTDEAISRLCEDPTAIQGAGAFVADHGAWFPHIRRIQGSRTGAMGLPGQLTLNLIRTVSGP